MRRLLIFAAAFAVAAGVYVFFLPPTGTLLLVAAGLGVLTALAGYFLRGRLRAGYICLLGACVGLLWCVGYRAVALGSAARYDGQTREVTVCALDAPMTSRYGSSVSVELTLDGHRLESVLYLREDAPEIRPGDMLRCTAKLSLAPASLERDDNRYYRSRGAWYVLSARSGVECIAAERTALRDIPARFSAALRERIYAVFDGDAAGFVAALLTGDRSGLSRQTRNELSIAGIYHTVAVSGMHVSILLGMVMLLCGSRRGLAAGIGIPVIVFFVLMTGAPASAIRAGVMQTLVLLAPLVRREEDSLTSLGAAGLFLLMLNPWSLYDVGLQLSFASVAGILLFAGRLYRAIRKKTRQIGGVPGKLVSAAASSLSCSLASTVFSLPLSAYYFGTVSLVAPLVNVLTLWAVSLCFTAGLAIALLAFVWPGGAQGAAWLLGWFARYVLQTARLASQIPCAAIYPENFHLIVWCVFYYAVITAFLVLPRRLNVCTAAISLLVALAAALGLSSAQYHLPEFTITALDVGQGQCLLFQCGTWTAVIDCGGEDAWSAGENAARYLQSRGEYRIEALVLTHYDADHAGGAVQLIERERVERVYLPDSGDDAGLCAEILAKAVERGTEVCFVREDETLTFDGGSVRLFAPLSDKSSNDSGICVLASAGKYDMLVTGDMTAQTELRLLAEKKPGEVELLVAGHHGAQTSTSYALLGHTRPQTVLISVGEGNSYGHPSPDTLARIETVGATVYRTDECGTITIRGPRDGKTDDTSLR